VTEEESEILYWEAMDSINAPQLNDEDDSEDDGEEKEDNLPNPPDLHLPIRSIVYVERPLPNSRHKVVMLICTVTKVEWSAVMRHMRPLHGHDAITRCTVERDDFHVGVYGLYRTAVMQIDMSAGRAARSVEAALAFWKPKAVFAVGIANGTQPGKQQLGDVLVSERLGEYDLEEVSGAAGDVLVPKFRAGAVSGWKFCDPPRQVHHGLVLSGSELPDSRPDVEALLRIRAYSEAVGIERGGGSIVSTACNRARCQWIVVKGISGFGKPPPGTKTIKAQRLAAEAAASLVLYVLAERYDREPGRDDDGLFAVMWDEFRTVALHLVHGKGCESEEYHSGHCVEMRFCLRCRDKQPCPDAQWVFDVDPPKPDAFISASVHGRRLYLSRKTSPHDKRTWFSPDKEETAHWHLVHTPSKRYVPTGERRQHLYFLRDPANRNRHVSDDLAYHTSVQCVHNHIHGFLPPLAFHFEWYRPRRPGGPPEMVNIAKLVKSLADMRLIF